MTADRESEPGDNARKQNTLVLERQLRTDTQKRDVCSNSEPYAGLDKMPAAWLAGHPDSRPGIAATAYDTAWLASVPSDESHTSARFPLALQWLVDNQRPDGSWGGSVQYDHDRILCTLAALVPLATYGRNSQYGKCLDAGTRFLWQRGHALAHEPTELVAFELLLPTMILRAQKVGIMVPPHLDIYSAQRAEKLNLIPAGALYSPRVTIVHSLEFLGEQADLQGLHAAQFENGSIGNSPAATAFFYGLSKDREALAYLEGLQRNFGCAQAPVLYPCETYELLWSAYHLYLAGIPAEELLSAEERWRLTEELKSGGVSLSPTFPIPDADDTAVAILLLHELGEEVDPAALQSFSLPEGNFASFQYERNSSVGVSLHALHTLLKVPGYPNRLRAIDRVLDYLASQQVAGLYWLDKWHISPYYATAHALCVMAELSPKRAARMRPLLKRSRDWLLQTQYPDGSWGFYGQSTLEETAFAVLALTSGDPAAHTKHELEAIDAAARYLKSGFLPAVPLKEANLPPLWIDKCLYTPTLVVHSAIASALVAYERIREGAGREKA